MKKLKKIKQYQAEKGGLREDKARKRQAGKSIFGTGGAKAASLTQEVSPLREFGSLDEIQNRPALQMAVYQTGDLQKFRYFLEHRRCFQRQVQRQMILDGNLAALAIFLEFREFEPEERKFMVKFADPQKPESMTFLRYYIDHASLGKIWTVLARDGRFPLSFIRQIWSKMPTEAQEVCNSIRHVTD